MKLSVVLCGALALAAFAAPAAAGTMATPKTGAVASAPSAADVAAAQEHMVGSFWSKARADDERAVKVAAEALAKALAKELLEKAAEAAAAALLGADVVLPPITPTSDDLERAKMIHTVNSAKSSWTAGFNPRFWGKPLSAIKRQLGVVFSGKKQPLKTFPTVALSDLPTEFDSRTAWPMCKSIQEIRDQSDCGSCWAFGAVEAASDRICIDSNGANQAHLSAEVMTGCCSSCGNGCDGGDPGSAWEYMASTGIQTGGNYGDYSWCSAYEFPNCDHHVDGKYGPCGTTEYPTPACPTACDSNSTYTTPFNNDAHVFNSSYSISSDPSQIMQEIMSEGPVEASFTVYSDFEAYIGGVYQHVSGDELGLHAIKILGWGVAVDGEYSAPYWLVANSWNTDWGEQGFFRILRGSDECGIEDNINAGQFSA